MNELNRISAEAARVLYEILAHESEENYWEKRFDNLSPRDDAILRGCFKELKDRNMISVKWADDCPYYIQVLKDGYLYEQHLEEHKSAVERSLMSPFEKELHDLLSRASNIKPPINEGLKNPRTIEYNKPSNVWINDVEIFYNKYLTDHSLGARINSILFHRTFSTFSDLIAILESISKDTDYINKKNGMTEVMVPKYKAKSIPEFDVFISHANKDKSDFVDALNDSLKKLGVSIFYDKESLEWGDVWKDRILSGTQKAEFAIIVISENFFDREWTEKELNEFLSRQNRNGQKIILPIIHNISVQQLAQKYPAVADIQAIDSSKYSCDEIALLFAKQLIKKYKMQ